ncbi:MAG: helix-turn-helix domain-containing protein [Lachnospiraceae bacterium]|nr:helix-turn-helix domain-containing protein [Lachnospiraceae bacterium]
MTFGEKLYKLRKAHGLSQEALAEKLNTSRQAVSKWENNNGYPETEKIILISKIFQITLDDLLIDDKELGSKEERKFSEETKGFYVSRETANGFLFYYKKKFLLLAAACGIALGCNSVSYTSTEHYLFASNIAPILTTISIMMLLAIVIYIALKQNPYRMLRKKELVFDEEVRTEIQEEFIKMKKMLVGGIAIGLVIFGASNSGWGLPIFENMSYTNILFYIVFSMVLTGISSFITFFCIGIYWSYSILLRNPERKER